MWSVECRTYHYIEIANTSLENVGSLDIWEPKSQRKLALTK
jgi:hypothetical protein